MHPTGSMQHTEQVSALGCARCSVSRQAVASVIQSTLVLPQ
jgi:hypothetical protein